MSNIKVGGKVFRDIEKMKLDQLQEVRTAIIMRQQEIAKKGMKVLKPSKALEDGFKKIGEQLTIDWLKRAGAEGQAVVDAYRKM